MRFAFGEYQLDTQTRSLERRGTRIALEAKAFDLLAYLIEHRDRVVSADELLDSLWSGVSVTPAALSRTVGKARRAVGDDGERQAAVHTEHGHGFRFVAEVSVAPVLDADESGGFGYRQARRKIAATLLLLAILAAVALLWVNRRASAPLIAEPSIAVLPFANFSGDPQQDYFADGITEELIHTLATIEGVHVTGRTSSFFFKGKNVDLRTIGEKLGVRNVLEGSVRRSGNRIRITVQLVDANDGIHRWSETYDREVGDMVEIQEEISRAIAATLRLEIDPLLHDALRRSGTSNAEAYEAYLKGREFTRNETGQSLKQALAWFERASALDPEFVDAHVSIAAMYCDLLIRGVISPEVAEGPARSAIRSALERSPASIRAQVVQAWLAEALGEMADAEASYRRALELNPDHPWANMLYGYFLVQSVSRPEAAIGYLEKTVAMDPLSPIARSLLGGALGAAGRDEEAILLLRSSIETEPNFFDHYWSLGDVYGFNQGRIDEMIRWYVKAAEIGPDPFVFEVIIQGLLTLGDAERAASWLAAIDKRELEHSHHRLTSRYLLRRQRGEMDEALEMARLLGTYGQHVPGFHGTGDLAWLRQLQAVDGEAALVAYARIFPEIMQQPPAVNANNYAAAASLAILQRRLGNDAIAEQLVRSSLAVMDEMPIMGMAGYGLADVMAHLVLGNIDEAMEALRRDLAAGWRYDLWVLRADPVFEPLWDLPEFQSLMADLDAEMATQLANLREMERSGELMAIPRDRARLN